MLFIDNETTGLLKPSLADLYLQPYITEICIIKTDKDFNQIDEVNTLINPGVPIPDFTTKITGITDAMVEDKPKFFDIFKSIAELATGERGIVTHNASFDLGVLKYELMRIGMEYNFPWPINHICTVEATRHLKHKMLKLSYLHELATGKPHEGAHRAQADVHALIRCYQWLVEKKICAMV